MVAVYITAQKGCEQISHDSTEQMEKTLRLTTRKKFFIPLRHLLIRLLPIFENLARPNICFVVFPILFLQPLYTNENEIQPWLEPCVTHKLTLCSITSFLHTLSKYPSHIFLNLSRMSFSTSSSDSCVSVGKAPLVVLPFADLVASSDRVPDAEPAEICFVCVGGAIPR